MRHALEKLMRGSGRTCAGQVKLTMPLAVTSPATARTRQLAFPVGDSWITSEASAVKWVSVSVALFLLFLWWLWLRGGGGRGGIDGGGGTY